MRNVQLIAAYEYVRHVRRRSFLFAALGFPLLIAAVAGIVFVVVSRTAAEQRIGLIDQTGRFAAIDPATLGLRQPIPFASFADEAAARTALDGGSIDAYVVIPQNYVASGDVRAVGSTRLSDRAENQLRAMLRQGLLTDVSAEQRARAAEPFNLVLRTLDGGREFGAENFLLFFLPYAIALVFVITTFTTSGYLLQAITEEKEGRVIELLATSVSPTAMMAGKIIGLCAVGLTQVAIWIVLAVGAFFATLGNLTWLNDLQLPWSILLVALPFFLLGYLLIATCYAMLGAAVTTPQEAQPLIAPISLLAMAPLFVLVPILSQPNGAIAVVLSLIPFSAPMTMLMRLPLADIPAWQIGLSLVLLALSTVGAVWLAARVMRVGMLRVGKRLSLRELWNAAH